MRESALLRHIVQHSAQLDAHFPQVVVGPGHDCAVIATPGGECLLLKVDQVIAGRHFRPWPQTPLDLIARKAIARAISDIAAAGGQPIACLVSAVLPPQFPAAEELFDALSKWSTHWRCPLVGGDTGTWSTSEPGGEAERDGRSAAGAGMIISVSIIGVPHAGRGPVLRSGAEVGDGIYMTGELGGSLDRVTGHGRHLLFEPRLAEARWLCDGLGESLHAMMDISDGLGRDAGRIAAMSGLQLRMEAASLPLRQGATDWRQAAAGGEDYELLFTAAGAVPAQVPRLGTRITRIGTVVAGSGSVIVAPGGGTIDASELGWDHGAGGSSESPDSPPIAGKNPS